MDENIHRSKVSPSIGWAQPITILTWEFEIGNNDGSELVSVIRSGKQERSSGSHVSVFNSEEAEKAGFEKNV